MAGRRQHQMIGHQWALIFCRYYNVVLLITRKDRFGRGDFCVIIRITRIAPRIY